MNLACTSLKMRARWAAQLALSTLVLTAACTEDSDDTDTDAATTNPTAATDGTDGTDGTDATTQPTTGDAESTGGTTGGAAAVSYAADIQPIWDAKCNSCHFAGGSASMGPVLTEGVSHANIVDKQSPTAPLPLVAPGDPDGSYLWHKLNGTQTDVGGAGSPMPLGIPLDADSLAKIEQWISEGANP